MFLGTKVKAVLVSLTAPPGARWSSAEAAGNRCYLLGLPLTPRSSNNAAEEEDYACRRSTSRTTTDLLLSTTAHRALSQFAITQFHNSWKHAGFRLSSMPGRDWLKNATVQCPTM